MKKRALIIGANGQDASYLIEHLLSLNYDIYGTLRRNSVPESQTTRIDKHHKNKDIELIYADLLDPSSIDHAIRISKPNEIYHLAAQSHVRISFDLPRYTTDVNCIGTLNVLESVRNYDKSIKIYNASSSEMYGNSVDDDGFQRITTKMTPVSPYGCSKLFAYNLCNNYRAAYGMFICSGILFNHESPRRGINFVTNKIVTDAVKIKRGIIKTMHLGNLKASRDWGHAKDYVKAMQLMMQQDSPKNYVIATGVSRTVNELLEYVFDKLNLKINEHVEIDKLLERPEELNFLRGDASIARNELGWYPEYTFHDMINEMIEYADDHIT
jgi:GDPmannose 4,6-dehydratase